MEIKNTIHLWPLISFRERVLISDVEWAKLSVCQAKNRSHIGRQFSPPFLFLNQHDWQLVNSLNQSDSTITIMCKDGGGWFSPIRVPHTSRVTRLRCKNNNKYSYDLSTINCCRSFVNKRSNILKHPAVWNLCINLRLAFSPKRGYRNHFILL